MKNLNYHHSRAFTLVFCSYFFSKPFEGKQYQCFILHMQDLLRKRYDALIPTPKDADRRHHLSCVANLLHMLLLFRYSLPLFLELQTKRPTNNLELLTKRPTNIQTHQFCRFFICLYCPYLMCTTILLLNAGINPNHKCAW